MNVARKHNISTEMFKENFYNVIYVHVNDNVIDYAVLFGGRELQHHSTLAVVVLQYIHSISTRISCITRFCAI